MKIKQIFFILLFVMILFIPNIARAEGTEIENIFIYVEEPTVNGIPAKTASVGSPHCVGGNLKIQWYESADGINYTEMTTERFDYLKYYKFDLIEDYTMDEGWECGGYSINEDGKAYSKITDKVFERFMKYYIFSDVMDGIKLSGPEFVVEGERYFGKIELVEEGYRLPIMITANDREIVIDRNTGEFSIDEENINSDIFVFGYGREITNYDYINNSQEYRLNSNKDLEFTLNANLNELYKDNDNIVSTRYGESWLKSRVFINETEIIENENFEINKDTNTIVLSHEILNTLEVGEYSLKIELKDGDAITTFKVSQKEYPLGTSNVEIKEDKIIWLKEDSNGQSFWFGIDNSNGTFEHDSNFWVRVIGKDSDNQEWQNYYNKIDERIYEQISDDNILIFLIGITNTNGEEYKDLNNPVRIYVQYPDEWSKDIKAIFINEGSDESIYSEITEINYPEGKSNFSVLILNHFSPYAIYAQKSEEEKEEIKENIGENIKDNNTDNNNEENTENPSSDTNNTDIENTDKDNNNINSETINNEDSNKATEDSPQTGDNIVMYVLILTIAVIGIRITTKIKQ